MFVLLYLESNSSASKVQLFMHFIHFACKSSCTPAILPSILHKQHSYRDDLTRLFFSSHEKDAVVIDLHALIHLLLVGLGSRVAILVKGEEVGLGCHLVVVVDDVDGVRRRGGGDVVFHDSLCYLLFIFYRDCYHNSLITMHKQGLLCYQTIRYINYRFSINLYIFPQKWLLND